MEFVRQMIITSNADGKREVEALIGKRSARQKGVRIGPGTGTAGQQRTGEDSTGR